jgi:hypothetical protein
VVLTSAAEAIFWSIINDPLIIADDLVSIMHNILIFHLQKYYATELPFLRKPHLRIPIGSRNSSNRIFAAMCSWTVLLTCKWHE